MSSIITVPQLLDASSLELLISRGNLQCSPLPLLRWCSVHGLDPVIRQLDTMATSHHLILVAAFIVMFTGSADAWCKAGFKSCDKYNPEGCETCVANDVNNCGDCHYKCPKYAYTTPTCSNGKCGATCVDGWKDCNNNLKGDGCEANVKSDASNCGGCGIKCSYGGKCVNGKCINACKPGWRDCNKDGVCEADCGNDVNNCGECNHKCVQPKYYGGETVCRNGKCVEQCKKGMKYDKYKKCCV